MAARKKAARSGAKTSGKGKAGAKASATGARGSSGKKAGKRKKATKKAVSASGKRPARPGHPPVKVAKATRKTTRKVARKATRKKAAAKAAPEGGFPEIADLAELMQQHGLVEVEYERSTEGATRIHVKRAGAAVETVAAAPPVVQPAAPVVTEVAETPAPEPAPPAADELHAFKSPMVGTFYRAPSPEASSFANVGDIVDPSSTVCIIEAMKVMNEITPDVSGEVVSIEVENGEAVEFGQTLMLIRTS